MFARAAELYVVSPGVCVRTAEAEERALTSLSNGLELERHENVPAFDCAIKMLEARVSVAEGFSRCQLVPGRTELGPASLCGLAGGTQSPESAALACKSRKAEPKHELYSRFRAPACRAGATLPVGPSLGSQSCFLTGFSSD